MNKNILVVEDEIDFQNDIKEILLTEGYKVITASNGKQALSTLKKIIPDLILSDIQMPVMDGIEFIKILQKEENYKNIPFIFLTSYQGGEIRRRGMSLGADDFLNKPFTIDDLINAIKIRFTKVDAVKSHINHSQEEINLKIHHEFRTPLIAILGYSELIEDLDDIQEIKKMARAINTNGKNLQNLIEKFLLYEDLITKTGNLNKINPLETVLEISSEKIKEYLIELETRYENIISRVNLKVEPSNIIMHEIYMQFIVQELVENAVKYSPPLQMINIKGKAIYDKYEFCVCDHGRGLHMKEIDSIAAFQKFGENKDCERGVGLGLSLIQKILKLFSCSFKIDSKKNNYSTVKIIFNKKQ